MASSSNTNTNAEHTPKKRRLSHLTTHYDYSSPIFRQAEKPLYAGQHTAPLDFKYHPILFNYHLMYDVYHDTCWAIKHKDITAKQWNLHLNTPHNYPCINAPHCPLQFVEQTHLQKHIPICKASQLLMATRKERSKDIHKNLINFPKQIQKKTLHKERVWITSYPDQSYVCEILIPDDDFLNRKDPSYMDPKNHPPIAINECFFGPVASSEEVKEQKQNTPPAPPPSVHELKPTSVEARPSGRTDSEHDNHQHTHAHNNNVSHVIHTTHNNHNNTNNGRILQAIHTTNHHYDGTNEHKAQSSDDESSFASFPTHGTMSMPTFASFPIHLPNLNAFPLQTSASVEAASNGTKRKAEALNDTDGLMPPHKKQKLNPYITNGIPMQPVVAFPMLISPPKPTATVTKLRVTPISGPSVTHEESKSNDSSSDTLIVSHSTSASPNEAIMSCSRTQSVLSTSDNSKFRKPLSFCRMSTDAPDNINNTNNINPTQKHSEKTVINLIEEEEDSDGVIAIENDAMDDTEWCNQPFGHRFRYIFHPFHIYSVSQQFTEQSQNKAKKKKHKKRDIKCYKMTQSTAQFSEKELCQRWEGIKKKHLGRTARKFNGSEISFEFLSFVEVMPLEKDLNASHIKPSADVERFLHRLYAEDDALEYLNVYEPAFRGKMRALLCSANPHDLSFKSQVFLYSFLRCGVGLLASGFEQEWSASALHIHDAYYKFLNDHFCAQSVYRNGALRDIAFKSENAYFKEFVFRHHPDETRDWSNCTLDLSLKMGGVMCDELQNLLEQCEAIQSLKTLYNSLYPAKQLRLVNMGFFQSPPSNPGQNWHTDYEFTSIYDRYTQVSPVVTVFISLIKQKYEETRTSGSTVFCLGSNHSPTQIRKLAKKHPQECKEWLYRVVQPVLNKGDIACFAGHVMHFGGAYNCIVDEAEDRVALYGVLHLLDKDAKHDEYLETDMNLYDGRERVESLFGGGRYTITRNSDHDANKEKKSKESTNPYSVKKHRRRGRF
eukprot:519208_1